MDLKLENKNAVILASTKGIGKAVAKQLLRENCNVAIGSRNKENLNKALEELRTINTGRKVIGHSYDLSNNSDIDQYFNQVIHDFGDIDILITNAGGPASGKFESFDDDDWIDVFEQNFLSIVRSVKKVLPGMKKQQSGKIIAITSLAVKAPVENLILSNAIRAGVTGLIKSLANELALYKINVNSVCPGYIMTDRVRELSSSEAQRSNQTVDEVIQKIENSIPLGRLGTPDEFAGLVAYLCSENANYVTGTTFWMDGGRYPGLL